MKAIISILFTILLAISPRAQTMAELVDKAENSDSLVDRIKANNLLSWKYYAEKHKLDSALHYADNSIRLNQGGKYKESLSAAYYYRGNVLLRLDRHDEAREAYEVSLKIAKTIENAWLVSACHNSIAWMLESEGALEQSKEHFTIAYEIGKGEKDTMGMLTTLGGLTAVLTDLGELDESEQLCKDALLICEKKAPHLVGHFTLNLARTYNERKEYARALEQFNKTEALFNEYTAPDMKMAVFDGRAASYRNMGQTDKALPEIMAALKMSTILGYQERRIPHLRSAYVIFKDLGMADSALHYYEQSINLRDSIDFAASREKFDALELEYNTAQKESDLAQTNLSLDLERQKNKAAAQDRTILSIAAGGLLVLLAFFSVLYIQKRKNNQKLIELNNIVQANLEEKEVLLGEIHHRVKNNLQLVSTMLELQSLEAEDPNLTSMVEESKMRIQTMALIHQVLYQYDELKSIDMQSYLRELIDKISAAVGRPGIENEFEIDNIKVNIDTAIPIALIVNELYTNSLKYAFESKNVGKVNIELIDKGDHLMLTIRDNGEGFDTEKAEKNFGSKLVSSFSRQLKAAVDIQSILGEGTITNVKITRFERA